MSITSNLIPIKRGNIVEAGTTIVNDVEYGERRLVALEDSELLITYKDDDTFTRNLANAIGDIWYNSEIKSIKVVSGTVVRV